MCHHILPSLKDLIHSQLHNILAQVGPWVARGGGSGGRRAKESLPDGQAPRYPVLQPVAWMSTTLRLTWWLPRTHSHSHTAARRKDPVTLQGVGELLARLQRAGQRAWRGHDDTPARTTRALQPGGGGGETWVEYPPDYDPRRRVSDGLPGVVCHDEEDEEEEEEEREPKQPLDSLSSPQCLIPSAF
ncbi:FAM131 domain-containing protein isoform X1 [Lates japonicus]|uniref:FAM131 domain-containing protein isoform X1 n=1 Tax=Lates japonicus TaxID=270547 RepID=A0AAD3MFA3_LATJO|nr:FAM131 domain-containing protein isoform X1 [Lates japonicus]